MTRFPSDWQFAEHASPAIPQVWGATVSDGTAVIGSAWDISRAAARARAVGEAIERHALKACGAPVVTVDSASRLGAGTIDLEQAACHPDDLRSTASFQRFGWTSEARTTWTTARSFAGDDEVLVPLDLCAFRAEASDPLVVRPMSSVGTAAAPTVDVARDRAIAEVKERHVLASAVRHGLRASPIDVPSDADDVGRLVTAAGLNLHLGCFPPMLGTVVAVAAVVDERGGRPAIAFGSGSGTTVESASRSAMLEAIQVFHLELQLVRRRPYPARIGTAHERARWVAELPSTTVTDTIQAQDHPDPPRVLEIDPAGWAWVDLTPPWSADAHVVRVVAPNAEQLLPDSRGPVLVAPDDAGQRRLDEIGLSRCQAHPFV